MKRPAILYGIIIVIAAIAALAGCARKMTAYDRLYASLSEKLDARDWSVLDGRTIVIDPGHGGAFRGAFGADSLTEAEVNLGVALYLWGLLGEAGADVHLTRTTDRDFLPPGSEELRDDLEARVARANSLHPEVFISIHHNSNISLDRERNRVEVYYRGDDPRASLELARDIHIHLARNLGIDESEIRPGNYHVLRNSESNAAVLGEASYISNPSVEEKLRISGKLKLEAECYFMGLVSYFSKGVPRIELISPSSDTVKTPEPVTFRIDEGLGVPIETASARVTVNGREVRTVFDPLHNTLTYQFPPDAPNGKYTIRATARSTWGATAASRPSVLLITRPARHFLPLPAVREADSTVTLRIKVLDELGLPVADGTTVFAIPDIPGELSQGTCTDGIFSLSSSVGPAAGAFIVGSGQRRDTVRFDPVEEAEGFPLLCIDGQTGSRIPFPIASVIGSPGVMYGASRGRIYIPPQRHNDLLVIFAKGYRPGRTMIRDRILRSEGNLVELLPAFDGILRGKKIALDPVGGGADHGGLGKRKLRGESVNLEVTRRLEDMLENAGASVILTRRGEESLSIHERIYRINRFGADVAIQLRHGPGPGSETGCRIHHYPGSRMGSSLAGKLEARLQGLPPCGKFEILESAAMFLQQTNCPACAVQCGSVEDENTERVLSNFRFAQLEAERLFSAFVSLFGQDSWQCLSLPVTILIDDNPLIAGAVSLDNTITMLTDRNGRAVFTCVSPGKHFLTFKTPDGNPCHAVHEVVEDDTEGFLINLRSP